MRKFSFSILFLTLILALTVLTSSAQRRDGRDRNNDEGDDRFRPRGEEMASSDLREGKHQDRTSHIERELNPFASIPGFALTTGNTTASSPIIYHNGPVMNTPAIYIIFYGNWNQASGSNTAAGRQIILDWAAGIGNTSRYAVNDTFDAGSYNVTGNATFGGFTIRTGNYKTRLRDSDILNEVSNTITSGALGAFNPNGVYFLVTSSDVTATSGFCTQYCGWHSAASRTFGRLRYSFVGNAARCLSGCAAQSTVSPNGNPGVDGSISILTHELEEAHTDPDLNAWYDASGSENSDKCAWTFGHFQFQTGNGSWANVAFGGRNYLIQRGLKRTGTGDFCMQDFNNN